MATHLPVAVGAVTTIPDDSTLSDLPHGQVDYLSHNWREEDVWRSWRNMTRLKNEIANGVRLENASWRTWWKQRNGLKTITPETLNWLKDSDVTWLYGPLHTADPVPRPSPRVAAALDLSSPPSPTLDSSTGAARKPILKHRSICELLTSEFPLSPLFSPPDSEEEADGLHITRVGDPGSPQKPIRPSLMHTKSDTHVAQWGPSRSYRRDSPPRVMPTVVGDIPASSLLQSESPPPSVAAGQKRKHISFNTFVEQCIAIDKPKKKCTRYSASHSHFGNPCSLDDDGYDEDSEDGIIDEADEILFDDEIIHRHPDSPYAHISCSPPPHNMSPSSSSTSEEEDDDDDDGLLQMRSRHSPTIPCSPAHSSSSNSSESSQSRPPAARPASHTTSAQRRRGGKGFIMRSPSTDKELVTIAFIAPTILKTRIDEDDDDSSPHPLPHSRLSARDPNSSQDIYGIHDSPVELVYVPPSYVYSTEESEDMFQGDKQTTVEPQLVDQTIVPSSLLVSQSSVVPKEHVIDSTDAAQLPATGADPKVRRPEPPSTPTTEQSPAGPEVIISSLDGHPDPPLSKSRSGSRSRSRSRTPSPSAIIASTNAVVNIPPGPGSAFLAPSDSFPSRGRSMSSQSLSSQAQAEQPRGRSITRSSSFSDRESLSTGSPLGSLSPDGNVGLGIGSVVVRDRDRDTKGEREGRRTVERGRDRCTRRPGSQSGSLSNSSPSPEDPHAAVRAVADQPQSEQLPVAEVRDKCISGSSSSGSSMVTIVPASTARLPPRLILDAKPITQTNYTEAPPATIPISPSYAQEEQESISRHPTPANSPILSMHPPPSNLPVRPSIVRHERRSSSGSSRSPTRNGDDGTQGTLVGRAVEIMSNAGAFLGSFWHSGAPAGAPTS